MRNDVDFGPDGEIYLEYKRWNNDLPGGSESRWMVPGTHADDPSTRE